MAWVGSAIIGGATLLSGVLGSDAADDAADAQVTSSNAGIAEQRRQFDQAREDLAPYRTIGTQALNALGGIYGYTPYSAPQPAQGNATAQPTAQQNMLSAMAQGADPRTLLGRLLLQYPGSAASVPPSIGAVGTASKAWDFNQPVNTMPPSSGPNYANFFASPDYQFRRDEGTRDIGNSFAARGGAASGNALRALAEFNSGLAAGEFGNYFNRQAALAGIGQSAVNTGVGVGQNTAANVGNLLGQAGSARASGILGQNAAYQNMLGGAVDAWYMRGRPTRQRNALDDMRGGSWG